MSKKSPEEELLDYRGTMRLGVWSIPHTGSTFTSKLLADNGVDLIGERHILGDTMEKHGDRYDDLVIPLRHPQNVARSWDKRIEDHGAWADWDQAWDELGRICALENVFVFDVEAKDIDGLSDFVGQELVTDWEPVNHSDTQAGQHITDEQIEYATRIWRKALASRQTHKAHA